MKKNKLRILLNIKKVHLGIVLYLQERAQTVPVNLMSLRR
jgi:hypothetical protein